MKTVTLVDDSETILLLVSDILADAGHFVATAHDAGAALARFQAGAKTDLLITDLVMPDMNGIDLIRKVRALPAYAHIPILMHTTDADAATRSMARAVGASGWLAKPVTTEELLDVVGRVLR